MALTVTRRGVNDDGTPHYAYESDGHVLITGPIKGTVELEDGTVIDVSPDVIEVASPEHAGEIAHHIAARHEAEGHPQATPDNPFWHHCTDHCGPAKRPADHPAQAAATEKVVAQVALIPDDTHRAEVAAALGVDLPKSKRG